MMQPRLALACTFLAAAPACKQSNFNKPGNVPMLQQESVKDNDADMADEAEAVEGSLETDTEVSDDMPPPGELQLACKEAAKNGTLKSMAIPLFFPAKTTSCDYGMNDNLGRRDGVIRARREEFAELSLQGMTRLCNMKFDAPQQNMRFDDEIVITLNSFVVASSQDYSTKSIHNQTMQPAYPNGLPVDADGLVTYRWLPPNGMQNLPYFNGRLNKYCLGLNPGQTDFNQLCQIPQTSTNGTMKLALPQDAFLKLAAKAGLVLDRQLQTLPKAQLGFVTTGDDDGSDCQHLDFRMTVTVDYIP